MCAPLKQAKFAQEPRVIWDRDDATGEEWQRFEVKLTFRPLAAAVCEPRFLESCFSPGSGVVIAVDLAAAVFLRQRRELADYISWIEGRRATPYGVRNKAASL
jgi:hypothetical protein